MDQLLCDGGDLDSMDRSLLDYGGGPPIRGGSSKMVTSPLAMSPPPPAAAACEGGKLSPQQLRGSCSGQRSPMTPPVSPVSASCASTAVDPAATQAAAATAAVVNGSQTANHQQQAPAAAASAAPANLIKKDMVVRFQENSAGGVTSNQTHLNYACQPQQLDVSQMHSYSVESLPESSVEGTLV